MANLKPEQFSNSRLIVAAIFAFVPPFGIIGVHEFILRRYTECLVREVVVAIILVCCIMASQDGAFFGLVWWFSSLLLFIMWIWSVVDGCKFFGLRKNKEMVQSLKDGSAPKISNVASDINGGLYSSPQLSSASAVSIARSQKGSRAARLSFSASVITAIVWLLAIVGDSSNSHAGASGGSIILFCYYCSIGVPAFIVSISFGIKGLKTSSYQLARASLWLKAINMIVIAITFMKSL